MRFSAVLPFAAAVLALDIENPGDSAIGAHLSENANRRRDDGPAAPPAAAPPAVAPPAAGAYTVITTVPRRSQGPCKFAIDVLPAKDAPAAILCRAEGNNILNGFNRGMAGLLAARIAKEYDPNCVLTENTAYHVGGDPGATYAIFKRDDNTNSRGQLLKQRPETFFLDCGAVFVSQPVSGPSGTGTAPQVKMIRDSRGLIPLMSEWFPTEFFASQQSGGFSDDAPPPWYEDAKSGI
ncbi:hypothetical protein BBO_00738 [Beauveria brongniartii RCEF 3172]|uniref:Uncharacterized protein n=1 Tax=Beauveria brongniartii RCEF 3172 TaxID=1081107 RepID=A0A167JUT1_9HYPO|nr:hypothetical protein BBO_00738 [Beauveria brongniartii RCEF 3172]